MRLAVYTDYTYRRDSGGVWAERAFALFLGGLAARLDSLTVVGRLDPSPAQARYRLPSDVGFVALPFYESLARPGSLAAMVRSLAAIRRSLDDVDAIWLLGPHPLAIAAAAIAVARRKRVFLGVRQDLPAYLRARHPGCRAIHAAGDLLDLVYRLLARRFPTVVVGPALARRYSGAGELCEIAVSLVPESSLARADEACSRSFDGELSIISVGRLEQEKNPLLLADVLARLAEGGGAWRLEIFGEGPLAGPLEQRLAELGVADRARLRGYARHDALASAYRQAQLLLHCSWTEGFPQVIVEALGAGLPVVASDVGGIRDAVGDSVVLVPPGDAEAAASALERLAGDPDERARLVDRGLAYAREHTAEAEIGRLVAFFEREG